MFKYEERKPEQRLAYLRALRQIIQARGSKSLVYIDESGFEPDAYRRYGWSLQGQKVHGERSGNKRPRTRLIAARRGDDFLAPIRFPGTANADFVNTWVKTILSKELHPHSTLIFDNAAFHKKQDLEAIA